MNRKALYKHIKSGDIFAIETDAKGKEGKRSIQESVVRIEVGHYVAGVLRIPCLASLSLRLGGRNDSGLNGKCAGG
jgi:hypothetical protein